MNAMDPSPTSKIILKMKDPITVTDKMPSQAIKITKLIINCKIDMNEIDLGFTKYMNDQRMLKHKKRLVSGMSSKLK